MTISLIIFYLRFRFSWFTYTGATLARWFVASGRWRRMPQVDSDQRLGTKSAMMNDRWDEDRRCRGERGLEWTRRRQPIGMDTWGSDWERRCFSPQSPIQPSTPSHHRPLRCWTLRRHYEPPSDKLRSYQRLSHPPIPDAFFYLLITWTTIIITVHCSICIRCVQ